MNKIKEYFLNQQRVNDLLLCFIVATIPFKINVGNFALIIALIYCFLFFRKKNLSKIKSFSVLFPLLYFIISAINGLLSNDHIKGLAQLDRHLLLVIILIILINSDLKKKESLNNIFNTFFIVTTFGTLVLLFNALIKIIKTHSIQDGVIFHGFTSLYDQHPVYYSLYLSFCLFYGFKRGKQITRNNRIIYFTSITVLLLGLLMSISKAVLFIDLMLLIGYLIYQTKSLVKLAVQMLFITVLTLSIFQIPFVKERFLSGLTFSSEIADFEPTNNFHLKKRFSYEEKTKISDLELRYILFKIASYHLISDGKLLFGYGQGDVQDNMDYYYFSYNLGPNWYEGFNVHNQYLHILLTYGIFVLSFFFLYLIYSFKIALNSNNFLHLFFLLMICFVFVFEVPLIRNKGIVFFYFFNSMFLLKYAR